MTTTQQPMKLAMKCVYCGSVKHEAREASGTCIQELIYALNDSVKREQVLREALTRVNCIANNMSALPSIKIVDICETALAATEVQP